MVCNTCPTLKAKLQKCWFMRDFPLPGYLKQVYHVAAFRFRKPRHWHQLLEVQNMGRPWWWKSQSPLFWLTTTNKEIMQFSIRHRFLSDQFHQYPIRFYFQSQDIPYIPSFPSLNQHLCWLQHPHFVPFISYTSAIKNQNVNKYLYNWTTFCWLNMVKTLFLLQKIRTVDGQSQILQRSMNS